MAESPKKTKPGPGVEPARSVVEFLGNDGADNFMRSTLLLSGVGSAVFKFEKSFFNLWIDRKLFRFHDESSLVEPAKGASVLTAIRYMHAASTDMCIAGPASSGSANGTGVRKLDSQDCGGAYVPQDRPVLS